MERVTISLDDTLLADFDRYVAANGYLNRSEAIRDLVRERLERDPSANAKAGYSVGCASYVFNHRQRGLAQRLTASQHDHHDIVLSTLHVHLDHENCFEVALLRGPTPDVNEFARSLIAETGVRHGQINLASVEVQEIKHAHHRHGKRQNAHLHLKPAR